MIEGYTDDTFRVNNITVDNGRIMRDTISNDWYNDTVVIDHEAYKAQKGQLKFKYLLQ